MAKLVDAHDSGSCGEILGGSNPPIDTIKEMLTYVGISFIMKLGRAGITFWGSADFGKAEA